MGTFDEMTAQERAAKITDKLKNGEHLSTRKIMELTGLSRMGVWHLMNNLSLQIPIGRDEDNLWAWVVT